MAQGQVMSAVDFRRGQAKGSISVRPEEQLLYLGTECTREASHCCLLVTPESPWLPMSGFDWIVVGRRTTRDIGTECRVGAQGENFPERISIESRPGA